MRILILKWIKSLRGRKIFSINFEFILGPSLLLDIFFFTKANLRKTTEVRKYQLSENYKGLFNGKIPNFTLHVDFLLSKFSLEVFQKESRKYRNKILFERFEIFFKIIRTMKSFL